MILRKLQNWTKLATVSEFCRFTRDQGIEKDESEYLAAFSEEIVVTADAPQWLWNGVRVTKHPTMIVHQPDLELATANTLDAAGNPNNGAPNLKWETEVEKTEAILRQFEEASRNRIGEVVEGSEEVETIIEDALQDLPLTRSLEALDLAGV
ncbi:DNA-binding protein SMUBP-2 [Phytophthora nicotianae]|nr:DNA-binding protein SMUBP-2 [Phytophthora nicotianae]